MKNKLALFIIGLVLVSCGSLERTITITNPAPFDRENEMVELTASVLNIKSSNIIIKDAEGNEVAYQWIYNDDKKPQSIIFQADVKSNNSAIYVVSKGKPAKVNTKTWAQFVPERKDDFAWENDLAAYRMYGPALAKENPSNGVDLWLKNTSDTVVTKRYRDELKNGLTYHIDHGNGLDCYKVGHTLGAGGIAPYIDDSLWVGNQFDEYKVLENGPLRSTFVLTYNSVKIADQTFKQTITITADAGSQLNKAVVKFEGDNKEMKLAGGIFVHDNKGIAYENAEKGIIAYAENAVSDAGVPSGRNYVGVVIPVQPTVISRDAQHLLLSSEYEVNTALTYYFGGGWSKWGYATDTDWFNAMNKFAESKKQPLSITVK